MNLTNLLNNIPYSKNNVIIFDIDGTLLHDIDRHAILETLEFYYYCLYKQYAIYIITERPGNKDNISYTIKELEDQGVINFDKIYFTNPDKNMQTSPQFRKYKKEVRNHIKNLGFNIIFSIGDQVGDYDMNSGIGIKVVNNGQNLVRII